MAEGFKTLGQAKPAANVLTDLYVVPAFTSAVVSTVMVCNQQAYPTSFRISIAIAGAADIPAQYLYYDAVILGNDTVAATIGVGMSTTDVLRVQSSSGNISFNALGVQVT